MKFFNVEIVTNYICKLLTHDRSVNLVFTSSQLFIIFRVANIKCVYYILFVVISDKRNKKVFNLFKL